MFSGRELYIWIVGLFLFVLVFVLWFYYHYHYYYRNKKIVIMETNSIQFSYLAQIHLCVWPVILGWGNAVRHKTAWQLTISRACIITLRSHPSRMSTHMYRINQCTTLSDHAAAKASFFCQMALNYLPGPYALSQQGWMRTGCSRTAS